MTARRALRPNQPTGPLFVRAHRALKMTHGQMADALGVSRRTISRWYERGPSLGVGGLRRLAQLVFPVDPKLAEELAWTASETLESLGLVAPAPVPVAVMVAPPQVVMPQPALEPAPSPPPEPPLPRALIVDAVVCAAAEAHGVTPAAVRGTLLAAFRRARELRLKVEEVEDALAPAPAMRDA